MGNNNTKINTNPDDIISVDAKYRSETFELKKSLREMQYQDQLQKVYDLTFPNANYQPMSPDFTDQYMYYKAIAQFIENLETLHCVFCSMSGIGEGPGFNFRYTFSLRKDALEILELFFKSHCPKNIPLECEMIDEKALFISCSVKKYDKK